MPTWTHCYTKDLAKGQPNWIFKEIKNKLIVSAVKGRGASGELVFEKLIDDSIAKFFLLELRLEDVQLMKQFWMEREIRPSYLLREYLKLNWVVVKNAII